MKTGGLVVMMLILGYLLGGWGPNGKILALQDELDSVRNELKTKQRGGRSIIGGVSQMLDIPEDMPASRPSPEPEQEGPVEEPIAEEQVADASEGETLDPEVPSETFQDQIDLAADAWAIRSEIARNAFVEQVDLAEDQAVRFNVVVEAMNLRIESAISTFVDEIAADDEIVGEELGIRLMNQVADVMVLTYDELDRSMPDDWRNQTGTNFKLADLIDPYVAMPLIELEQRLDF